MLDYNDLQPFVKGLTEDQSRIVIEDVEGELARIAPSLLDSANPTVLRILRAAGLRYFDYLQTGARRVTRHEVTRGPFMDLTQTLPNASIASADIFTPSEIQKLNDLADITTATPLTAAPVGLFPESPIHGLPGYDFSSDYTYQPTDGIGWLGQ
jgi:hypothetical protein